jgi:NitT/TauT family transport system permease protein
MHSLLQAFSPNQASSKRSMLVILAGTIATFAIVWSTYPSPIMPKPLELIPAFRDLIHEGMLREVLVSFITLCETMLIASCVTFILAILTTIPVFRPGVRGATALRFMSFAGLTLLFTLMTGGGHWLKLALLTFAVGGFMLTSKVAVVANIPRSEYDHARTLYASEWRVTWEVVILGKMDQFIESVRQNAAIVWMALPAVEKLVMAEGGFGTLLFREERHFNMEEVFAIQLTVFAIAIFQDYLFGVVKFWLCPHAKLNKGGNR